MDTEGLTSVWTSIKYTRFKKSHWIDGMVFKGKTGTAFLLGSLKFIMFKPRKHTHNFKSISEPVGGKKYSHGANCAIVRGDIHRKLEYLPCWSAGVLPLCKVNGNYE